MYGARELGGTPGSRFVAWRSTGAIAARDRLAGARGWVRPDGLALADTVEAHRRAQTASASTSPSSSRHAAARRATQRRRHLRRVARGARDGHDAHTPRRHRRRRVRVRHPRLDRLALARCARLARHHVRGLDAQRRLGLWPPGEEPQHAFWSLRSGRRALRRARTDILPRAVRRPTCCSPGSAPWAVGPRQRPLARCGAANDYLLPAETRASMARSNGLGSSRRSCGRSRVTSSSNRERESPCSSPGWPSASSTPSLTR